ncbi:MAG: dethiobiotin synthase [Gammaproteobacteria bacterium]
MKGILITGTDTGVGKTRVAQIIVHILQQQYARVGVMKPVASGAVFQNGLLQNEDAIALQKTCHTSLPYALINPYCFAPAIAPHIAAELEGVEIDLRHIQSCYENIARQVDVVVVEGAGGWQTPLNAQQSIETLGQHLAIPVVLVIGLRLGCLNHALLTMSALHRSGVSILGWVGNCIDPEYQYLDKNIHSLKQRISAPCLGILPYTTTPDIAALATCLAVN